MTAITRSLGRIAGTEARGASSAVADWIAPGSSRALQRSFPQVYRTDGPAVRFGLWESGHLVSHAAVHVVRLVTPTGTFRAGLIGSVATRPAARGRGLASELLADVIAWCRGQAVDAALLWSPERALYARLGFEPAGHQCELLIRISQPAEPDTIRPAAVGDIRRLLELHQTKPHRVERDLSAMAMLLSTPGVRTMVLQREAGIVAYACHGKGIDFPNWWHELGGPDREVAALLKSSMVRLHRVQATVLLPPYRPELPRLLGTDVIRARQSFVAQRLALSPAGRQDFFVDGLDSI